MSIWHSPFRINAMNESINFPATTKTKKETYMERTHVIYTSVVQHNAFSAVLKR